MRERLIRLGCPGQNAWPRIVAYSSTPTIRSNDFPGPRPVTVPILSTLKNVRVPQFPQPGFPAALKLALLHALAVAVPRVNPFDREGPFPLGESLRAPARPAQRRTGNDGILLPDVASRFVLELRPAPGPEPHADACSFFLHQLRHGLSESGSEPKSGRGGRLCPLRRSVRTRNSNERQQRRRRELPARILFFHWPVPQFHRTPKARTSQSQ